jgi:CheY-like chemotaxis protein
MRDEQEPARVLVAPRKVSALVIDDDPDARELLATIAMKVGYTIATAQNGRDALELLRTISPGVIFVDLSMPIMNGAEFRQAQRRNREWLSIPTVVMTGTSEEPLLDLAIEQTLRKPVRASELLAIIARHAGR